MSEFAIDPDDLYDDATIFAINIEVFGDGCMKVSGDIHDKKYALACIDEAKAAVIRHHKKPGIFPPTPPTFLKPTDIAQAIQIKVRRNGSMSTGGSINDRTLALLILDHARDSVIAHHNKLHGGSVVIPATDTEFNHAWLLD